LFKIAVFCGTDFEKKSWKPGKRSTCLALFGLVKIDFKQAQLEADVTHVFCVNIFGVTRVAVPEEMAVNMSGISIFGRTKDDRKDGDAPKRDSSLEIASFNVFGATVIFN